MWKIILRDRSSGRQVKCKFYSTRAQFLRWYRRHKERYRRVYDVEAYAQPRPGSTSFQRIRA
jgi:hypothetical protein